MENTPQTKICTRCEINKNILSFRKGRNCCKKCTLIYSKEYFRTKNGLVNKIYSSQSQSSKRRGYAPPSYTISQLKIWVFSNCKFNNLFNEWVLSGYKKHMIPSIDRLDDYKGYSLDNIQLMTWEDNNKKARHDFISGKNNKKNKRVIQISKDFQKINEFFSIAEATRQTGVNGGHIVKCCKMERKTAGGYAWKYAIL